VVAEGVFSESEDMGGVGVGLSVPRREPRRALLMLRVVSLAASKIDELPELVPDRLVVG
jgi:hypothetical protein